MPFCTYIRDISALLILRRWLTITRSAAIACLSMNFAAAALGGYLLITVPFREQAAQPQTAIDPVASPSSYQAPRLLKGRAVLEPGVSVAQVGQIWVDLAACGSVVGLAVMLVLNRQLRKEIRQRQQVEARLRTSEERYATLAQAAPVGIFCSDAAGRCTYVNQRWCQMTGLTAEMASDNGWQEIVHLEDRDRVVAEWIQAIQEDRSARIEYRLQQPGGKVTWVYAQAVAERDASGQVTGYIGSITDIDDCKRSEEALRRSEAHQRALVSVLPDLIMRISKSGVFLEFLASPNFSVLGEPADWVGTHVCDRLPPKIAQERLTAIDQALQTQTVQIYEQEFSVRGKVQIEEVRAVPHGEAEVLFLVRDVSDRKQAELALQQSEAQSQTILNAIPDYLVRVGIDGRYREFAGPARDFAIASQAGLILPGLSLADVLPEKLADRHMHYLHKVLQTGELQVFEQTVQVGDRFQAEEVRVVKSGADEVLFIIREISDRKQAEAALHRKVQQEQTFARVVNSIRNSLDLATVFATATREIARLLPGLNCAVVQYLPQPGVWKIIDRVCSDPDLPTWVGFEVADADNPFADQLKQLQIVRVEDTREIDDTSNQSAAETMPGAWLMIPLAIAGEVWASLSLSVSQRPFRWDDELVSLLRAIANQLEVAIQQAQLYQQVEQEKQKLLKSEKALTQAQQMAQIGSWELDIATQALTFSDSMFQLLGWEPTSTTDLADAFANFVHPEDRLRADRALTRTMTEGISYKIDLRFVRADGSIGYKESRAEAIRNEAGEIVKLFGTSLNITDRKQAEADIAKSEVRYRKVVEAQTDFVLRSLPDTTITFANSSFCRALGTSLKALIGTKWSDFTSPEDTQRNISGLATLSLQQPRSLVENQHRLADGQISWIQWLDEGIFDESGQLAEIQSVGRDITALKQAEQALQESEEQLRLVTENMNDMVCLHHPDGRYLYVTPSSETLLGYRPEELIGSDPYQWFHPDDVDRIRRTSHQQVLEGAPILITYRARHKTEDYIWLETLTSPVFDEQGRVIHLQTSSREVGDRIKAEEQLRYTALHDNLTGLPNRTLLMERLALSLRRINRYPDYQFAVLFLDLDNFKVINDSLGHLVGDELLLAVAGLITQMIRKTDLAARLGGDEFVILLDGFDQIDQAARIAEQLLAALKSPLQISGRDLHRYQYWYCCGHA